MLRWLDRLSLGTKIDVLAVLFIAVVIAGSVIDVLTVRGTLTREKALKTRHLVEVAHTVAGHFRARELAGELDGQTARAAAVAALRAMRYDGADYFWINDLSTPFPRMVMHPTVPELDGQVLDAERFNCATSERDGIDGPIVPTVGGKNLFIAFNDVVRRAGHGFVTYDWPKPLSGGGATETLCPKLSYVKKFDGWDWVIGSGIYIDDVEQAVQAQYWLTFAGLLSLAVGIAIAILMRRALVPLSHAAAEFDAISQGVVPLHALPVYRHDEVGSLVQSFNRMQERLVADAAALRQSETLLLQSQRVAMVGHYVFDVPADRWTSSSVLDDIFGIDGSYGRDISGWLGLVHPGDRDAMAVYLRHHVLRERNAFDREYRIVRLRDGEPRWVHGIGELEFDAAGSLLRMFGTIQDITERKRTEERQRLAASVFTNTREGIVITDVKARILDVNDAFTRITGYSRNEVIGKSPSLLKSGHQGDAFYKSMWQDLVERGYWSGEVWNRHKNGAVYAELMTISAVHGESGDVEHYVGVFADITKLKENERELERMAHFDALTGIPNRALLSDRMAQAIAQTRRNGGLMAVCYLDLDGFKPVNDELGHEAGDEVLVDMAQRMRDCLRGGDTVARIGGDEFVLLLLGLRSLEECEAALTRILAAVAQPVSLGGRRLGLSASLGVTLFPVDDADADTLLRHADHAMYQAKQGGKNRYHLFDPEHDRMTRDHGLQVAGIEAGLAGGEFVLHYQPKVNMRLGTVLGVEALIRWQHPERGLLAPAEFLPAIEGSDLIVAVGDWVLDQALAQAAAWRRNGLALAVSVNIAPRHLLKPDFVARLTRKLAAHPDVPRHGLEIEVLETAAIEDIGHVSQLIRECRDLGVTFAIDDFGTGYSSLAYFKTLPAEVLKIDQTFVRNMLTDAEDMAIVEGVISLAEVFSRRVVAEGVESVEHGNMLLNLGCEVAQGYGIARPMPAADVAAWVRSWRPDSAWSDTAGFRWPRDDLPLMIAQGDYRRWVEDVSAYVAGTRDEMPEHLEPDACRFAAWYRGSGRERYGGEPGYVAVGDLHAQLHALGKELIGLCRAGCRSDARERLAELNGVRDRLRDELRNLAAARLPLH